MFLKALGLSWMLARAPMLGFVEGFLGYQSKVENVFALDEPLTTVEFAEQNTTQPGLPSTMYKPALAASEVDGAAPKYRVP